MSSSAFEHACAEFCEIARVAAPALHAEPDGEMAFHVDWRGVTVDLIFQPGNCGDYAFVLFDLGATLIEDTDSRRIHLALLQANFLSLRVNPPTFSCHPVTGRAMLQCAYPLLQSPSGGLFALIEEGVNIALEWRETFFLTEERIKPASNSGEEKQSPGFV